MDFGAGVGEGDGERDPFLRLLRRSERLDSGVALLSGRGDMEGLGT